MTTKTKNQPQQPLRPADLSIYELHTPQAVIQHEAAMAAYHESLREWDQRHALLEKAKREPEDQHLTEQQYFELSVKRDAERRAKIAEREAAAKAQADADAAYLASLPAVAEISEASEFLFLSKLGHWFALGYQLTDDSIQHFVRGCYAVKLSRPTAVTAKKAVKQ